MLRMRIDTRAAGPLTWTGTSYQSQDGGTRITPVANPAVEQVAVTDQTRTLVVVRERASGTSPTSAAVETVTPSVFERIRSLAVQWPNRYPPGAPGTRRIVMAPFEHTTYPSVRPRRSTTGSTPARVSPTGGRRLRSGPAHGP